MPPSPRIKPAENPQPASPGKPDARRGSKHGASPKLGAGLPFWRQKKLQELTPREWESLCDGCGRCCLVKLEDEDNGQVYFTNIACKLLDVNSCRCADYAHRSRRVRDCIRLSPEKVQSLSWLPPTCAYRLVAEGRDLPWWHPLVSGSESTVHEAGVSVRGRVEVSEKQVRPGDYAQHIVAWPGRKPRARRPPAPKA
ncbi:MAG: YcgN family cysteine cluster protein [Beijerinckiaceae bacterium]|nr:YcgN family cysteine cluster protein [Beijerinckiaceae bacterium]MCI0736911.1 YcgN family cysteine cluster protein [Beijerinckiaceae bacterium]